MRNPVFRLLLPFMGLAGLVQAGPYAPPAGQGGSTAISRDSSRFVGWATGYQDVRKGPNATDGISDDGTVSYVPGNALGPAEGTSFNVFPLGDGGSITLTFSQPITNGAGDDFAVFENAFSDTFLELAFVEVSSNGTDFFLFPSVSLTPDPIPAFGGNVDATNVDGLAGKYRAGYGTPFDLEVLSGTSGLDVNSVTHVRITDVVGDGSTFDSLSNPIYDPHGTTGTSGFDLDGVGVLNAIPEPAVVAYLVLGMVPLCRFLRKR